MIFIAGFDCDNGGFIDFSYISGDFDAVIIVIWCENDG